MRDGGRERGRREREIDLSRKCVESQETNRIWKLGHTTCEDSGPLARPWELVGLEIISVKFILLALACCCEFPLHTKK